MFNWLMSVVRILLIPIGNSSATEADRLFKLGIEQYGFSQFRPALESWQQALIIYRKIGHRQGEANSLNNLGNAYYSLGQYQEAIDFNQQSIAIFRPTEDSGYRYDGKNRSKN